MRMGFCCLRSPRRSQPPSPCACSDVQKTTGCSRATVAKIAKRVAAAQGPPFAFRSGRGAPYPRKRASGPLRPIAVAEGKGVADPRAAASRARRRRTSLATRPVWRVQPSTATGLSAFHSNPPTGRARPSRRACAAPPGRPLASRRSIVSSSPAGLSVD